MSSKLSLAKEKRLNSGRCTPGIDPNPPVGFPQSCPTLSRGFSRFASTKPPFLTYTTPTQWTFGFNTESSYDWENEQWSVPVNASASKLLRFGTQLVSVGGGLRYWLDSPDSGADGVGFRITVTLLFPR